MGPTTDAQLFLWLLLLTSVIPSTFSQCSTSDTHSPKTDCIDFFNVLQAALFNNTYNAFHLQSIFYPSSHLTPALVRVNYTLNDTAESTEQPLCNCNLSHPCTFAWTSRSLYQSFHPAVINQLQFQLPLVLMRLTAESLYDEPDLNAFLWDGTSKLPTVLLNLTINSSTLHDDLQQYLQSCDTVQMQNALGEVTKWLKAYADIQPKGKDLERALQYMDANLKAFTLEESIVNQYSYTSVNVDDYDIGMQILKFVLIVGFVAAFVLIPVFSVLLTRTFSLTLSSKWSHSSSTIAGVMLVSTMFCVMAWIAKLHQLDSLVSRNYFVDIKLGCMAVLYLYSFLVPLMIIICGERNRNPKMKLPFMLWLFVYVTVSMTMGFVSHIILILLPTVLMIFIYPLNTSALIFLHVALMYSMIVIIAIFTDQMYQWKTYMQDIGYCKGSCIWFFFLFYACCMLISIPLSYITTIELYQFIIGRNLYDEVAWNAFANYIPSVIIVLFTWLLNRLIPKDDEKRNRLAQAIVEAMQEAELGARQ